MTEKTNKTLNLVSLSSKGRLISDDKLKAEREAKEKRLRAKNKKTKEILLGIYEFKEDSIDASESTREASIEDNSLDQQTFIDKKYGFILKKDNRSVDDAVEIPNNIARDTVDKVTPIDPKLGKVKKLRSEGIDQVSVKNTKYRIKWKVDREMPSTDPYIHRCIAKFNDIDHVFEVNLKTKVCSLLSINNQWLGYLYIIHDDGSYSYYPNKNLSLTREFTNQNKRLLSRIFYKSNIHLPDSMRKKLDLDKRTKIGLELYNWLRLREIQSEYTDLEKDVIIQYISNVIFNPNNPNFKFISNLRSILVMLRRYHKGKLSDLSREILDREKLLWMIAGYIRSIPISTIKAIGLDLDFMNLAKDEIGYIHQLLMNV